MASDRERLWIRRLVTLAVLALLLAPLVRNEDGLPFSTYPMYSGTRSSEMRFVVATGVDSMGERVTLSILEIAETRDPLIAQSYLNNAVRRGDTESVCALIAGRVDDAVRIEIATERVDAVHRLRDDPWLLDRELHSSCEVAP